MPEPKPAPLFAALTDIGLHREENQDNYGYFEGDEKQPEKGILLIVADGMGGEQGGGVASSIAVKTILDHYKAADGADPVVTLQEGFLLANREIFQQAQGNPGLRGMGTTGTAMAVLGNQGYFVHVGDTRAYQIRGEAIRQLTVDQTWVQEMVGRGMLSEEEAKTHPQRNVLTQALGSGTEPKLASLPEPLALEPGDLYLLCSDGLSGLVSDQEMFDLTVEAADLKQACTSLVELAKVRGGHDNITVLLFKTSR
jgi:protein phosphatase